MSDPYKKLEDQLRAAVGRRVPSAGTASSRPAPAGMRRRLGRWPHGTLPLLAALAVLGSGAATAALVLRPDDRPENQLRQALFAGQQTADRAPACRSAHASAPRLVDDAVPGWVLHELGVLRRAATTRDAVPASKLVIGGRDILRRSVRVARAADGWSFALYLSRGAVPVMGAKTDPVACVRVRHDAALAAASRFSPAVQTKVRRSVDRDLRAVEDLAAGRSLIFSVMTLRPDGRPTGGGAVVLRGGKLPAFGSGGTYRRGDERFVSLSGILPDGVESVRILDGAGAPRERAVTKPIRDNVYHALLPRRFGPRLTVEWRSSSGRVLRRTHPRF